jgi:hypothetical protein
MINGGVEKCDSPSTKESKTMQFPELMGSP